MGAWIVLGSEDNPVRVIPKNYGRLSRRTLEAPPRREMFLWVFLSLVFHRH